jgi:hypothetical protein
MFYLPKITLKITKMIFKIKFVPRSLDYINTKHVDIINLHLFISLFIFILITEINKLRKNKENERK